MENSIQKRLRLQNEVLKWLNELSDNLQTRANAVTKEVHELLDQTDIVEQDMKNTLNSFRNLSYIGFVDNKISEEDEIYDHTKEDTSKRAEVSIRAQSYEDDILPRYKEALSSGLSSYRSHMQKTNRTSSSGSIFKTGLACDPLPHIIGSAEYIHDNSCGLTDDFLSENLSIDFSHITEPKGVPSSSGTFGSDTIFTDLFGGQQGQAEKDASDPLVSAALDFKAMLEAALLSPYKFYDEGTSSLSDTVHGYDSTTEQRHSQLDDVPSTSPDTVEVARSQHPTGTMDTVLPVTPRNLYSLQNSDIQTHKICTSLISESLFDTEEESVPLSRHETREVLSTENRSGHAGSEISADSDKEEFMHDSLLEDDDAIEKDAVPPSADFLQEIISRTSLSSPDDVNVEVASEH
ncbi:DASH complex subunit Dad2 [Macleaya cordata]|uniref:DASH complex subunit Dad2 n=1 Tax=Macleaya cordata TaxID=56857 RepID=A0A200QTW3_MACCD|nr:DASH complex subunit Dad2 [Macleaya cordata]